MKEFLFGCAYYPEYFSYDRMEEDFSMMRDAGFNVIRIAESTWSSFEKTPGKFDFSYIDRVLEKAPAYGLSVIIGTPTYAVPAWLYKACPGVMVETKRGREPYGRRQIFDLASEEFLYYAERAVRELVSHTASSPHVIGFQIDNETKHYDNFGERMQRDFAASLREEFADIAEFNERFGLAYWSNAIHRWEDFPDLKGCINAGLMARYSEFLRSRAAAYLRRQAEIIEEYKREDQFITHNFDFEWKKFGADIAQDGYSYGVQDGINHWEVSRFLTLAGTDIYHPTQDDLTGAEIAFCGDEIRCLKNDGYLLLECQAQGFKNWCPYPGQLLLHMLSHIAGGAVGGMYWNWHSIHSSFETYWKGVLSHDLQKNRVYKEVKDIGALLKKLGKEHLCITKENKIALLVDPLSLEAMKWFPVDRDLSYNDIVRYFYDTLYRLNAECDILYAPEADLTGYEMAVTPGLYIASEELLTRLEAFVAGGGVLVSGFRSFVANRDLRVYEEPLPAKLSHVFGSSYDEFTDPAKVCVGGRPVSYLAELLRDRGGEMLYRYEHPYWKEYGAVSRHAYKKGKAYYIGAHVDGKILEEIIKEALAERNFGEGIFEKAVFPCIVRGGKNALGKRVYYVMNYSNERQELRLSLSKGKLCNLLENVTYSGGENIILKPWQAAILEETV